MASDGRAKPYSSRLRPSRGTSTARSTCWRPPALVFGVRLGTLILYGTGGIAWAQSSVDLVTTDGAAETGRGSVDTHACVGWVAGAGLEHAASENWSFRLEYLHYDLGNADYDFNVAGALTSADLRVDAARAALTYKWR